MKLDILAFGAHPDDVELACSGTIAKHRKMGKKIGICDLTRGELSTRGDLKTRERETEDASKILGISIRVNMNLPDGFFKNDQDTQFQIVKVIRKYRPDVVLAPAVHDRHPDHVRASKLIEIASYLSGLKKITTAIQGEEQEAWRPRLVMHYIQDRVLQPDILVDVSDYMDIKMKAIKAYKSQFYSDTDNGGDQTPISTKEFIDYIEHRGLLLGRDIGVRCAEGFTIKRNFAVEDITQII